jgi:hypothetical protein
MEENIVFTRKVLDRYAFNATETILNEWNYVKGWLGDEYVETVYTINGLKGAAYCSGVMCKAQSLPVDMLMYYDARPTTWCGLFSCNTFAPQKPYHSFKAFGELYRLGGCVQPEIDGEFLYAAAATDGKTDGLMFSFYNDEQTEKVRDVEISVNGAHGTAHVYLLDENNDLQEVLQTDEGKFSLSVALYATYFIKFY